MRLITLLFCLLVCFSSISNADPDITNISGILADGGSVIISGTEFGAKGPSIRIYDDFDDGILGDVVDLSAVVGDWLEHGTFPPLSDAISYSGNQSMRLHQGEAASTQRIIKVQFPPAQEMFISYWFQIPIGNTFPGTAIPGKIPTVIIEPFPVNCSAWKLAWVFDGNGALGDNDVMLPDFVCGDFLLTGNNTLQMGNRIRLYGPVNNFAQENTNFRFGEWARITIWMKAGPVLTGPGNTKFTYDIPTALPSPISNTEISTDPVFTFDHPATGDKSPYQWTHLNMAGFLGNGNPDWSLTRPLFDDVYLATGPGAQARIELCEASLYVNCTKFGFITIDPANVGIDWTDTVITGTIRKGALSDVEIENGAFVYLFDENGLVNPVGYPICGLCPLPPINL